MRPICKNCTRRSEPCEYDEAPKRRGPDKSPGTRHRRYWKNPENTTLPHKQLAKPKGVTLEQHRLEGPERTARNRPSFNPIGTNVTIGRERRVSPPSSTRTSTDIAPLLQTQGSSLTLFDGHGLDSTPRAVELESVERLLSSTRCEAPPTVSGARTPPDVDGDLLRTADSAWHEPGTRVYTRSVEDYLLFQFLNSEAYIPRGPSSSFHKQTWWDGLLSLYSEDPSQSALNIFYDLDFL